MNQRKQSIDSNTEVIPMLELSNKGFKAVIIKLLQQEITNMFETSKKYKVSPKNRRYKEEPNRNFRTKHKIIDIKTQCMCSTIEWKEERKESVKLKIEQLKWPSLNKRVK